MQLKLCRLSDDEGYCCCWPVTCEGHCEDMSDNLVGNVKNMCSLWFIFFNFVKRISAALQRASLLDFTHWFGVIIMQHLLPLDCFAVCGASDTVVFLFTL